MKRIFIYLLLLCLTILMPACEYYLGFDQQPEFRNENMEEGLNIFGILRPDTLEEYNRSFVHVHRVMPLSERENFNIIKDAVVRIEKITGDHHTDTIEFHLVPPNTVFADTAYRPVTFFSPQAGERYRITCKYEGLPDVVGETTIPPKPEIEQNSLSATGRFVSFTLVPDSLIGMIDVYQCLTNTCIPVSRLLPADNTGTNVELQLPLNAPGTRLILYAYDQNMAVYIGNSNISLNFNKFRKTFSTLESGFGVFGAMNLTELDFPLN